MRSPCARSARRRSKPAAYRDLAEIEARDHANAVVLEHLRMREERALTALSWSIDRHDVPEWPVELGPASKALLGTLGPDGQAAVLAALPAGDREVIGSSPGVAASRRLLGFGAARAVPLVLERTGLLAVEPPDHIHAMCRGPDCVAGSIETADLILEALERSGCSLGAGARALDFGCSSGRVARVLAAVHPEVEWLGCDPNRPAIEWAAANLPVARFFVNEQDPPLALECASLDVAYGISIWSHFNADAGLVVAERDAPRAASRREAPDDRRGTSQRRGADRCLGCSSRVRMRGVGGAEHDRLLVRLTRSAPPATGGSRIRSGGRPTSRPSGC